MLVRIAFAVCFVGVSTSTLNAQALRDQLPGERVGPVDRAADGVPNPAQANARDEPGYLGLITDDRRGAGGGIRVVKVVEGSPAAAAGFRSDDLILTIEGADVRSLDQMARELEPRLTGDKVRFEVHRSGEPLTLDVTLARRPPRDRREFEFGRIPEPLPGPVERDVPIEFGSREGFGTTARPTVGCANGASD